MVYLDPFLPFEACLNGKINNKMYIYLVQITKTNGNGNVASEKKNHETRVKTVRWRWIESMNWVIRPVWIIGQKNNIEPMAIDECDWMSLPFSYTKITCIVLTISTPTNQKKNTQTQKGKWIYNMHTYNAKHNYPRAFGKMYRIFSFWFIWTTGTARISES